MDFETWQPFYEQILNDFGFSREKDEAVAAELDKLLGGNRVRLDPSKDHPREGSHRGGKRSEPRGRDRGGPRGSPDRGRGDVGRARPGPPPGNPGHRP